MGTLCVRTRSEPLKPYEEAFSEAENSLKLSTISIKKLESLTNEIAYAKKTFGINEIAKVFGKLEVMEDTFSDINGAFMTFFDGIENAENCKGKFILSCIPICLGNINEKADLVWIYTEEIESEGKIAVDRFLEYMKLVTKLSTSILGKIVSKNESNIDRDMKIIMEATDDQIEKYVLETIELRFCLKKNEFINEMEYDNMIKQMGNSDIFSSRYHRKRYLTFNKHM